MSRNVVMLVGINGVGKSMLAKMLHDSLSDSFLIAASEVLMQLFGGVSRDILERLSPDEKMRMMEPAFIELFEHNKLSRFILFDTHLIVPIRKEGTIVFENIWSSKYLPYINRAYFITSNAQDILNRRVSDYQKTGRKRDIDLDNIKRDQHVNLCVFEEIICSAVTSKIVTNKDGNPQYAFSVIKNELLRKKK